jgi:hypothetical protein
MRASTSDTSSATFRSPSTATSTSMRLIAARRRPSSTRSPRASDSMTTRITSRSRTSCAPGPRSPPTSRPTANASVGWQSTATATAPATARRLDLPATTSPPSAAASTTRWTSPRSPNGADEPALAIRSTHDTSHDVGVWRTAASRDSPPASPATTPAGAPQSITGPVAGTASRFAGRDATGSPPATGSSNGDTASWAAAVTESGSASHRGPGMRAARGRANEMMPSDAATDSWNPSVRASVGSTTSRTVTATPSTVRLWASQPKVTAQAPSPAMVAARRTDGSSRVATAKNATTPSVATSRPPKRILRSTGPASTSTNATLEPDTASTWVSPEPANASSVSSSCPRRSPSTSPRYNPPSDSSIARAPSARVRRSPFAAWLTTPPARHPRTPRTSRRPTMPWRRRHSASIGRTTPSMSTHSPT